MRKMIYKWKIQEVEKLKSNPIRFALLPVIVQEACPDDEKYWIVWLEWYEQGYKSKWLIPTVRK